MGWHLIFFVFSGILQLIMALWGIYVAIQPPTNKKRHVLGIIILGVLGAVTTLVIGVQASHSEREAITNQDKLSSELRTANEQLRESHDAQEEMKGKLSIIAVLIQQGSKGDLEHLAVAISEALHPQQPSPCLHAVRYTTRPLKSNLLPGPYAITLTIPNPSGFKAKTSFQVFFWDSINADRPTEDMRDFIAGGGGGNGIFILTIQVQAAIPKGHPVRYEISSNTVPVRVRCVDLIETEQK